MREFKEIFEELGYTFPSADVLEDVYTFYRYYNNEANKGVSAILLEGDPGCGKTFLSEVFQQFLGKDTEYIYTQCVEETNSDKLIATYNVPAIVKGDFDKAIAEGILTNAIMLANAGKKVVLTVDELDKAREQLDSYFLDFLQNGKIETADNKILSLTEEGRKNLYAIFAKNNERDLLDALLRRCSVIKLPPMPPVLAYKTLLRKFENNKHDPKFLKFICKVYEAIYNEQMNSNEELLNRLPALQELISAISSDYELYSDGISSTRRIKSLIRKLGKDDNSREIITDILTKKFKYQNKESNYTNETLNFDMDDPNDYMNTRDKESLVDQYIEKKDNGEYIFEEDEMEDPMKDIANILDNMKDDQSLVFIDKANKEKIVELGTITHDYPQALDCLFNQVKFKGNPNSRFGFLDFDGDNFVGLMKYKNTLILVANKEYVSPKLLMRSLSSIITIICDVNNNPDFNHYYFSESNADNFKLTGINAKILSNSPKMVLNKMKNVNGVMTYNANNLKITHDDSLNINYFRYLQRYRAEPIFDVVKKLCEFNPELAIPASFINAKKFEPNSFNGLRGSDYYESQKDRAQRYKEKGWKVTFDEMTPMHLTIGKMDTIRGTHYWEDEYKYYEVEDDYVFEYDETIDEENKTIHMYPKYKLNGDYVLYTQEKDFMENESIKQLDPFQKEIAMMARDIFGNFIPVFSSERKPDYFSKLTMSHTGRIVDNEQDRRGIPGISQDITEEDDFTKYYNSLAEPCSLITPEKVFRKK